MSFNSPFESVIISDIADNSMELLDSVPSETESGWDSLRETWLIRDASAGLDPTAALAALFLRGSQVSGKNMWVVSRAPRLRARGLFEAEIVSMGLLSPRGHKVSYDSSASSQSAENITTPDGLYAKVSTIEAAPTCSLEYIQINPLITPASPTFLTVKTGRSHEPPAEWKPTVPATIWGSLTDYTYHYPNGWIFDGVSAENLPGLSTVFLIRERYRYQYAVSP